VRDLLEVFDPEFLQDHAQHLGVLAVHDFKDFFDVVELVFLLDARDVGVEVLGERSVGQHGLVDQAVVGVLHLHQLLELGDEAHGVCSLQQAFGVSLVVEPVDDVDHVVYHVGDLAHKQEGGEWFLGVGDEEVPFVLEFGSYLGANDLHCQVLHDFTHEVLLVRVSQEGLDVPQSLRVLQLFVLFRFDERNQQCAPETLHESMLNIKSYHICD